MASGGARNRSGPSPDETSGRSDARGLIYSRLPAGGHTKPAPTFPLQPIVLFLEYFEEGAKLQVLDEGGSLSFREREAEVWAEAWRTPQAAAWALQSWRWPIIAEYCRLKTAVELDPTASAALVAQLHRYRDQIGLTPAGLKENGWAIAEAETTAKKTATPAKDKPQPRRLRATREGR